jgi:SSS family solute:Na+ symporter
MLGAAAYVVIAIYMIFVLFIGFFLSRFQKGGKDYFAGGNKIPWWISGVSLYMTNFSAATFVGFAGTVYLTGYYGWLSFAATPIGYVIGSMLTAKAWRRSRVISPFEYTTTRFNLPMQQLVGWAISICHMVTCGAQLLAVSMICSFFSGISIPVCIVAIGIVVLIYTYWGGIWAVSVADVVQFAMLLAITAVVAPMSIKLVSGGVSGIFQKLPPLTFHHTIGGTHYDVHYILSTVLMTSVGVASGMGSRFYSVVDEKAAKKVGLCAGLLFLTCPLLFAIPPIVAKVLWPEISNLPAGVAIRPGAPQETVFIAIVNNILPSGLLGFFVAAMLAATMDGLSSFNNMISAIMSRDVYKGIFRPAATDENLLKVGKVITLVVGVIVTGLALFYHYKSQNIFVIMTRAIAIFAPPTSVAVAFGLLFKGLPRWSGMASITWGLVAGLVTQMGLQWNKLSLGYQVYLSLAVSVLILFASYHVGKWYRQNKPLFWLFTFASTAAFGAVLWFVTPFPNTIRQQVSNDIWMSSGVLALFASTVVFGRLFSRETEAEKQMVEDFFKKLATPIDVAREVLDRGQQERSAFFLVGALSMLLSGVVMATYAVLKLTGSDAGAHPWPFIAVAAIMFFVFGFPIYYFGKKYRPDAEQGGSSGAAKPD